ncbi:MAG: type II toxin-antitoxin system VapC family toxin [Candidatus Freyarchaeota archaeon]|nr:type II toxin-antitoxin system VapC family toxin [Candidatus Freyrarchaeum guaymaensis]HDO81229.1 PIN domain-containing protein [Candidatus Bathyarchaeota archaeon]
MERVVGDASLIVKWFIEEEDSDKALKLRDMHVNGEVMIVAPELLPFEVLNALKYSNLFSMDELKDVAVALSSYGIELYSLRGEVAERAVEIAVEEEVTIYDASYVALAVTLNTRLYTADRKLVKRLRRKYEDVVLHVSQIP